jgi:hypothetical protein
MPFKTILTAPLLETLKQSEKILLEHTFISTQQYTELLYEEKLVASRDVYKANIRGILELLHLSGSCKQYNIYRTDLRELKKGNYPSEFKKAFIIKQTIIPTLQKGLDIAKSLPGSTGLASFAYLKQSLESDYAYSSEILELIKANERNITIEREGNIFYFVYNEKNTFLESMGKIFNGIAKKVEVSELANSLHSTFTRRRKIDDNHPPVDVIEEFIKKYPNIKIKNQDVLFKGKIRKLNSTEQHLSTLLRDKPDLEFTTIIEYLEEKGVKLPNIQKARYSPILRVNKGGLGEHRFSLIGSSYSPISNTTLEEKPYSDEDLEKDWKENQKIGKDGEKLIHDYLQKKKETNEIRDFQWVSEKRVNASYDFKITKTGGTEISTEVKSTKNNFGDLIYFSFNELKLAANSTNYQIYRVYKLATVNPRLRIISNFSEVAKKILNAFAESEILENITPTSLSLSPINLDFSEEFMLPKKEHFVK